MIKTVGMRTRSQLLANFKFCALHFNSENKLMIRVYFVLYTICFFKNKKIMALVIYFVSNLKTKTL
jgi:hypothetical protein